MSEQQKHFPEFYVTAPQPCPYLPGRLERKLFTHLTHDKPPALVDNLLKGGSRRSQNIAYMPYCEGCQACVSARVLVGEFALRRPLVRAAPDQHLRHHRAHRLCAVPRDAQSRPRLLHPLLAEDERREALPTPRPPQRQRLGAQLTARQPARAQIRNVACVTST